MQLRPNYRILSLSFTGMISDGASCAGPVVGSSIQPRMWNITAHMSRTTYLVVLKLDASN